MNRQEMQNKIEELESELSKLKEELNKPVSKVWKPKYGDTYYYICAYGVVCELTWKNSEIDRLSFAIGNCFRTIEEAEFEIERLKVIAELKRFAEEHNEPIDWWNSHQEKWHFIYSYATSSLYYNSLLCAKTSDIFFTSRELAQQAVEKIGEDKIKKYYFGVDYE